VKRSSVVFSIGGPPGITRRPDLLEVYMSVTISSRESTPRPRRIARWFRLGLVAGLLVGCGGDTITDPTAVTLGETTFVFVLNPVVNEANEALVPEPGPARSDVDIAVTGGPSGTTEAAGVLVLGTVAAGTRTVGVTDPLGNTGQVALTIDEQDLREVAVALDGSGAEVMAEVVYRFGGEVVEITPAMSIVDVNNALARSNVIVLLQSGSYTGDLEFSGSNVTLFGEGARGGNVTIVGNVTVSGSSNRIRGARISGNVEISGSDAGVSFSTVTGETTISGSDTVLLNNAFCGPVEIGGGGTFALGNAGLDPIAAPSTGC
jgi:hypothetical protein